MPSLPLRFSGLPLSQIPDLKSLSHVSLFAVSLFLQGAHGCLRNAMISFSTD